MRCIKYILLATSLSVGFAAKYLVKTLVGKKQQKARLPLYQNTLANSSSRRRREDSTTVPYDGDYALPNEPTPPTGLDCKLWFEPEPVPPRNWGAAMNWCRDECDNPVENWTTKWNGGSRSSWKITDVGDTETVVTCSHICQEKEDCRHYIWHKAGKCQIIEEEEGKVLDILRKPDSNTWTGSCYKRNKNVCRNGKCMTWKKYHRLDDHQKYLLYLHKDFPRLCQVEVIGKTHEMRPIMVLKICRNRACGRRPAIWVDGGIHPREWISPAAVAYLAKELVENNYANRNVTKQFDWFLLTVGNPDGYVQTFLEDRLRRKNRNPNNKGSCGHKSGVDLNRNFGYSWKRLNKKCHNNYPGEHEFSEPETQAIANFLKKRKKKILIFNTVHAAGEKIIIPWGHTDETFKYTDILTRLLEAGLEAMDWKRRSRYKIGNLKATYGVQANGGAISWAAGDLGVKLSYCFELVNKYQNYKDYDNNEMKAVHKDLLEKEVEAFTMFTLELARKLSTLKERFIKWLIRKI